MFFFHVFLTVSTEFWEMQIIFNIFISPVVKKYFDKCILLLLYMRIQKDLLSKKQFYGIIKTKSIFKSYSSYEKCLDNIYYPCAEINKEKG